MTAREIADLLDKNATLEVTERSKYHRGQHRSKGELAPCCAPMLVPVKIINARENFGRMDVLVTPEGGSGEAWVSAERVKVRGN